MNMLYIDYNFKIQPFKCAKIYEKIVVCKYSMHNQ